MLPAPAARRAARPGRRLTHWVSCRGRPVGEQHAHDDQHQEPDAAEDDGTKMPIAIPPKTSAELRRRADLDRRRRSRSQVTSRSPEPGSKVSSPSHSRLASCSSSYDASGLPVYRPPRRSRRRRSCRRAARPGSTHTIRSPSVSTDDRVRLPVGRDGRVGLGERLDGEHQDGARRRRRPHDQPAASTNHRRWAAGVAAASTRRGLVGGAHVAGVVVGVVVRSACVGCGMQAADAGTRAPSSALRRGCVPWRAKRAGPLTRWHRSRRPPIRHRDGSGRILR